ncbi:MAG: hypothetical protein KDK70_23275, partial [Myxococcales bacterium]|nr:hypothetical protein [Myxococcales bacterium]
PRSGWGDDVGAPRTGWGGDDTGAAAPPSRPGWGDDTGAIPPVRSRWDEPLDPERPAADSGKRGPWGQEPPPSRPVSSRPWRDPGDPPERAESRRHVPTERVDGPGRGWGADPGVEHEPLPRWDPTQREQETRPSAPRWDTAERERDTRPNLPRQDHEPAARRWSPEPPPPEPPAPEPKPAPWSSNAKTAEFKAVTADGPRRGSSAGRAERWLPDAPLSEPEQRRKESEKSLDRRRRETVASPLARPIEELHAEVASSTRGHAVDRLQSDLDGWPLYEEARRSRLGPDEQTEPDAPVTRRGAARAEISGAAVASSSPGERPSSRPHPKSSLGLARRPERPRPPEPRERGALLRGRAPARPSSPVPRQNDAPSLRHARRPSRAREETTSKFRAAHSEGDPEPGSG